MIFIHIHFVRCDLFCEAHSLSQIKFPTGIVLTCTSYVCVLCGRIFRFSLVRPAIHHPQTINSAQKQHITMISHLSIYLPLPHNTQHNTHTLYTCVRTTQASPVYILPIPKHHKEEQLSYPVGSLFFYIYRYIDIFHVFSGFNFFLCKIQFASSSSS